MSTDLALRPAAEGDLDLMTLGKVLSSSGYFSDARDAAQAAVKVLAGRELGLGAVASMTGIYLVKGKVALSANLMAAQIKRSGRYNYRVIRLDDTGCEIVFTEGGQEVGRSAFTEADAKAAGLMSNETYRKFPRNMYFARALSNGARWFTPDIFAGPVYTPDELREDMADTLPAAPPVNVATGEVIEAPAPVAARLPRGEGGAPPPARDFGEAQALVAEIRQLGGDPGEVTKRKLMGMDEAEYRAYLDGMRQTRDALVALAGSPEEPIAA